MIAGLAGCADSGYRRLFSGPAAELVHYEQKHIYQLTGLKAAAEPGRFYSGDCPPAAYQAELVDLNGDDTPEVFVTGGNTCTSGHAGNSIWLFVKRGMDYEMNLGFSAASATPMETGNLGFPDLRIGGPGFCEPVWRWNGTHYDYFSKIETEPGGCAPRPDPK